MARKDPLSNVSILFGPGRTFGRSNIVAVPPVTVPPVTAPRQVGPGNVHDPFGALTPRLQGAELPPGAALAKPSDNILVTKVSFNAQPTQQITTPFDIRSVRLYGYDAGCAIYTQPSAAFGLDGNGYPADPSYVGTCFKGNDTTLHVPSTGIRTLLVSNQIPNSSSALNELQYADSARHIFQLNESSTSLGAQDTGLNAGAAGTYNTSGVTMAGPSLDGTSLQSALFDGNAGYATITGLNDFDSSPNGFSVEFLIYPTRGSFGAFYSPQFLGNGISGGDNTGFEFGIDPGGFFKVAAGYGTGSTQMEYTGPGGIGIPVRQVTHIVFTYNPSTRLMTLYLNGSQNIGTGTLGGAYVKGDRPLIIGASSDLKNYFQGAIQDVAVYNYALSEEEVLNHYGALSKAVAPSQGELLIAVTDEVWSPQTSQIFPANITIPPFPEGFYVRDEISGAGASVNSIGELAVSDGGENVINLPKGFGSQTIVTVPTRLHKVQVVQTNTQDVTFLDGTTKVGYIPANASVGAIFDFNARVQSSLKASTNSTGGGFNGAQQADSPIHLYRLNDASTATSADTGSSPNNGTNTNTSSGAGLSADALSSASFNGSSSHIALPFNDPPMTGQAFSIECLLQVNALTSSARVIANDHTDTANKGFQLRAGSSGWEFDLGYGTGKLGVLASGSVAINTLYHVVIVNTGTQLIFYVNGTNKGSATWSQTYAAAGFLTNIGYNPAYTGDWFNGLVQSVAFYNVALSATQVTNHYNAITQSPTANSPELIIYTD